MDDTYMRKKHAKWIGRAVQLQQLIKNKGMDDTYENSLKQILMTNWKDRMQSSLAQVSKWIQRKSQPAMCLPAECSSRSKVTAEIRQFWEKEWNKPQEDPQS